MCDTSTLLIALTNPLPLSDFAPLHTKKDGMNRYWLGTEFSENEDLEQVANQLAESVEYTLAQKKQTTICGLTAFMSDKNKDGKRNVLVCYDSPKKEQ